MFQQLADKNLRNLKRIVVEYIYFLMHFLWTMNNFSSWVCVSQLWFQALYDYINWYKFACSLILTDLLTLLGIHLFYSIYNYINLIIIRYYVYTMPILAFNAHTVFLLKQAITTKSVVNMMLVIVTKYQNPISVCASLWSICSNSVQCGRHVLFSR